jgi:hypothetical protein
VVETVQEQVGYGTGIAVKPLRPMSFLPEAVIFFVVFWLISLLGEKGIFDRELTIKIWAVWMWGGLFGLATIQTLRTEKKEAQKRAASPPFVLGFISGAILWVLYIRSESSNLSWPSVLMAAVYVLLSGVLLGCICSLWSYLLLLLMRTIGATRK